MRKIRDTASRADTFRANVLTAIVAVSVVQGIFLFSYESEEMVQVNLILQLMQVAVFGWWARRRWGTYISAPFLFVLAIFFWHSSFLAGHYLRLAEIFEYTGNVFSFGFGFVSRTVAMIGFCLSGTIVGAYLADRRLEYLHQRTDRGAPPEWTPFVRKLIVVFFGMFFSLTAAYLLLEGIDTFDLGYMALYSGESGSFLYRLFQSTKFFWVSAILILFASRNSRSGRLWALGSTAVLILINALMGSRSMPFIYALALVVAVDAFWRRFRAVEFVVMSVAASAISYVIDHTRGTAMGFRVFDFASTGRELDLLHVFWNAGSTVGTVLRTIEFSASSGLIYGQSFLDAVIYLVPRAIVDGLGLQTGFVTPSVWLVDQSPDIKSGAGLGYSLVAESYLNFGWFGPLIFLPIGAFIGWHYSDGRNRNDTFSILLAYNVAIIYSLHMRNDAGTYLRAIVYGYMIIELARRMCAKQGIFASPPRGNL